MTIPVPQAKYNLLNSEGASRNVNQYHKTICLSAILLLLLIIPLISLFALNFFIIHNADDKEIDYFESRAELYSVEEFINKNSDCKSCNLPPSKFIRSNKNKLLKLVCYYNSPNNTTQAAILLPENIDCNLCTHINVAFGTLRNSSIILNDQMKKSIVKVVNLKKCNRELKVLLSLGGASVSDSGFPDMIVNHATRKTFIRSLKSVLKSFQLDGVDLDWEFPNVAISKEERINNTNNKRDKRQRQHFTQLLREIKSEYIREKKNYILTVAVAAPESIVNVAYDVEEMNNYVDFINVMTYDFHFYTTYTPFTGFNSPLYSKKGEVLYLSTLNINYTANLWLSKGMDRDKIVIGLPLYGHSFTLVNSNNGLPGSPANGFGKLGSLGFVEYFTICNFLNSNKDAIIKYDNETFSPYFYKDSEWVSYENQESIIAKGNFIKEMEFGGAMVYSLNTDDFAGICSNSSNTKFYLTQQLRGTLLDDDL